MHGPDIASRRVDRCTDVVKVASKERLQCTCGMSILRRTSHVHVGPVVVLIKISIGADAHYEKEGSLFREAGLGMVNMPTMTKFGQWHFGRG